jgi:hypothetical protein
LGVASRFEFPAVFFAASHWSTISTTFSIDKSSDVTSAAIAGPDAERSAFGREVGEKALLS